MIEQQFTVYFFQYHGAQSLETILKHMILTLRANLMMNQWTKLKMIQHWSNMICFEINRKLTVILGRIPRIRNSTSSTKQQRSAPRAPTSASSAGWDHCALVPSVGTGVEWLTWHGQWIVFFLEDLNRKPLIFSSNIYIYIFDIYIIGGSCKTSLRPIHWHGLQEKSPTTIFLSPANWHAKPLKIGSCR